MQGAVYQLSLVIGLGTLAVLLIRGYSLMLALQRSGLVLIIVLMLLLVASSVIRWNITPTLDPYADEDKDEIDEEPEQIPGQ